MIQVLERAAGVLELLGKSSRKYTPLSEIADTLGIDRGTCANIIKSLKELGFIEQEASRKGYSLGYKVFSLAKAWKRPLSVLEFAKPVMDALRDELNENIILSTVRNDKRILLHNSASFHEVEAKTKDEAPVYHATTGKLFLAYLTPGELDDFIRSYGLPGPLWPEIGSREDMEKAFAKMRKDAFVFTLNRNHVVGMAVPIFLNGKIIATLGTYLPDYRLDEHTRFHIEKRLRDTAIEINSRLMEA